MYIYIYIYIYIERERDVCSREPGPGINWQTPPELRTATLRTQIMDFRGFGSSGSVSLRGGILRPIGDFPESLSQSILVGITLGRLGVLIIHYL